MQLDKIVINFYIRKILQDDSGGTEWDFSIILRGLRPVENRLNVLLFHGEIVAVTDSALKEDTDRVREGCCRK